MNPLPTGCEIDSDALETAEKEVQSTHIDQMDLLLEHRRERHVEQIAALVAEVVRQNISRCWDSEWSEAFDTNGKGCLRRGRDNETSSAAILFAFVLSIVIVREHDVVEHRSVRSPVTGTRIREYGRKDVGP